MEKRYQTFLRRSAALALSALLLTSGALAAETAALPAGEMPALSGETPAAADWQLLLVNPWEKLPTNFSVTLTSLKNGMQVDGRIYDDLSAMLDDCWAAGLQPQVCSAYRSESTQKRLYRNKIARLQSVGYSREEALTEAARWVAVPGTSEHQTGLALDLVSAEYPFLDEKQAETPEQQWFMAHCWEYGFILRYPADKIAVTGIGYEPWHYRYVGRETATALQESGLCLEEYLAPATPEPTPAAL